MVVRAKVHFDLWSLLYVQSEERRKNLHDMQVHSQFFVFDMHAHFVSWVLHTYIIFDKGKRTLSLERVLHRYERFSVIPSKEIDSLRLELDRLGEVAEGVKCLRNSVVAHRNIDCDYKKYFAQAKVKPDQVGKLLSDVLLIVNRLQGLRNLKTTRFNVLPRQHLSDLFDRLKSTYGGSP